MIDHPYSCNGLTTFKYEKYSITGNGHDVNLFCFDFQNNFRFKSGKFSQI